MGSIVLSLSRYLLTQSESLGGLSTKVNVFIPEGSGPFPVLYYLAGLTCNEDTGCARSASPRPGTKTNGTCRPWKGGFLAHAAEHQIALVFPDTSPRGAGIVGEDDSWDFGTGAPPLSIASHTHYITRALTAAHTHAHRCGLLPGCDPLDLVNALQNVHLHNLRATLPPQDSRRAPTGSYPAEHLRALDGWPRRNCALPPHHHSGRIQVRLGICTCA